MNARVCLVVAIVSCSSACVITSREVYDARYSSLTPSPQGPAIAGPRSSNGATVLGLGVFSGFGGAPGGTRVEGAPGNIFGDKGARLVIGGAPEDSVELGGALSIRPGALGTAAAEDTSVGDVDQSFSASVGLAGRWWVHRIEAASFGFVTELGVDLLPYSTRTVVQTDSVTTSIFGGPIESSSVGNEVNRGVAWRPRGRAGPVAQVELTKWLVLTGGLTIGNDFVVQGHATASRTCVTRTLDKICDGPRTGRAPTIGHTVSIVPFVAPGIRVTENASLIVQLHAAVADPEITDHVPFGAEAGFAVQF